VFDTVINTHCHIICKELYSDAFWEGIAAGYAKSLGVPTETVMTQMMPQTWASDASVFTQIMADAGVDKAFICHPDYGKSIVGEAKWSIEQVNKWYIDQRDQFPDKLEAVVGIDPRRGEEGIKLMEKAAEEWGVKAVKIYAPCGFFPDDPQYDAFYAKCQDLGLMLQSHTAALTHPLVENKYANPMYLDRIAARFPDLNFFESPEPFSIPISFFRSCDAGGEDTETSNFFVFVSISNTTGTFIPLNSF